MKFKELLTKIITGLVTNEEKNIFWDCVDNNDDLAELLCECQVPKILLLMCENDFIKRKPYFKKYSLLSELINSGMNISNVAFTLEQLKNDIAPYLTAGHINILIEQLQIRSDAIKTIMDSKANCLSQIDQLRAKQKRKQESNDDSSNISSDKKQLSKSDNKTIELEQKLRMLREQERLLVSTFNKPDSKLDYLKKNKSVLVADIKNKENDLLENPLISFEIGEEVSIVVDQNIEHLQAEIIRLCEENNKLNAIIESLKVEKEKVKDGMNVVINEKKDRISELEKRCINLRKDKEQLEIAREHLSIRLSQLEPKVKKLESQVKEYDQMLMTLNGRMYEVLSEAILDLERKYFNLNDFSDPMDPKAIATFFAEPIKKIRKGLEKIRLNTSLVKILDKDYSISLMPCANSEDWEERLPVDYDPQKHILQMGKAKKVYIITRGFSYINNLGVKETILAEVRAADESTNSDEEGTT